MAQQMLEQQIQTLNIKGVSVKSAGTMAMPSHGLDLETSNSMQSLGFNPKSHSAQQVTVELIREADLILTASTDHRTNVVEMYLGANRYAFTLLEFAALAEYFVTAGLNETSGKHENLLEKTNLVRGYGRTLEDLDIEDPYNRGPEVSLRVANEIKLAIEWVAKWLS